MRRLELVAQCLEWDCRLSQADVDRWTDNTLWWMTWALGPDPTAPTPPHDLEQLPLDRDHIPRVIPYPRWRAPSVPATWPAILEVTGRLIRQSPWTVLVPWFRDAPSTALAHATPINVTLWMIPTDPSDSRDAAWALAVWLGWVWTIAVGRHAHYTPESFHTWAVTFPEGEHLRVVLPALLHWAQGGSLDPCWADELVP